MLFYILLGILIAIALLQDNKYLSLIVSFALFLILIIRWEVGYDFDEYYSSYLNANAGMFELIRFNKFYQLIYYIAAFLNSKRLFFIITSILFYGVLYLLSVKSSIKFIVLLFFIYYTGIYFNSMNQIRQVLASMVFLLSIPFLIKKEWFYYYLLIAFSIILHLSSIYLLFIPIYIYVVKYLDKTILIAIQVVSFFLFEYTFKFLEFIVNNVPFLSKYSYHFDPIYLQMDWVNYLSKGFKNVFLLIFLLFIFDRITDQRIKISSYLAYLGVIMGNFLPGLLSRLALPLVYSEALLLAYLYTYDQNNQENGIFSRVNLKVIVLLYASLKLGILVYRNVGGFIPYSIY